MFILKFFFFTRFGLILTILGVVGGGFYFWLNEHDKNITNNAISTFNAAQEQIYQKKADEFVQKTQTITNDTIDIITSVNKQNDIVKDDLDSINKKASDVSDGNRQSSNYLKNIINQLNNIYGGKK